jgi:hypothetical protein
MKARRASLGVVFGAALAATGCGSEGTAITGLSTFHVVITKVDGSSDLPTENRPLPANRGDSIATWDFTIEARSPSGELEPFNGIARLSSRPGTVLAVSSPDAIGRNIFVRDGRAAGSVDVTAVYGPSRLWVEDIGYTPTKLGDEAGCSNGANDDGEEDVLVDFPNDPGCAFADDESESGGSFAAGVSQPVHYALPSLVDIQGESSLTPYPNEAVEVDTKLPRRVVVTNVTSDGFNVTDITEKNGYNHLFAFNFSTPANMGVCDVVTQLSGTVNDFFGFTELSFPSFQVETWLEGTPCPIPKPIVLDPLIVANAAEMEKVEAALVRVAGVRLPLNFGPDLVENNSLRPTASNCDLNGDGQVDFESDDEGSCSSTCESDLRCSEWNAFTSRGNIKVSFETGAVIQVNLARATGFDPRKHKGTRLDFVTGTLRNFSGGSLNWTVEARCADDLVCGAEGCVDRPVDSKVACPQLRTINDNDEGTN